MVKLNRRGRNGGATLFLCIILSALILSQTVLLQGAIMRFEEGEISRAAHLQAENILSGYNDRLYDHYGVYAFDQSSVNSDIFALCCRVNHIDSFTAGGTDELSTDQLKQIINDYMKLRFPAIMGNELLIRVGNALDHVKASELLEQANEGSPGVLKKYLVEYMSSSENWADILNNVENFVHLIDFNDKLKDFEKFIGDLKETIQRVGTLKLQSGDSGTFQLNIFDPNSIEKLMNILSFSIDSDVPELFNYFYINKYAVSLFDSNLTVIKEDGASEDEANIYGESFMTINKANFADIEYLLTGKKNESAINYVKTMIFSTRAVINLASMLLDKEKMSEAEGIAAIISVCIAIVSGGTAAVEPSLIKYIVIGTWAIYKSVSELNTLCDGGSVTLIDHSALNNQGTFQGLLSTRYRDYIEMFILFVNRDVLLNRMVEVFKRYTDGYLFVSVRTEAKYKRREFIHEEGYDSYKK